MTTAPRPVHYLRSRVSPNLIPSLQEPKGQILWVGCSDSGFAETRTLDVLPEEIIVHRNPGCVLSNDDLSTASTLEYALRILDVRHIVVCGHYDCRFVNVGARDNSMVEWLRDVEKLYDEQRSEIESIGEVAERNRRLVELHVWSQLETLKQKPAVAEALRGKGLKVHAFVYDSSKAECTELIHVEQP